MSEPTVFPKMHVWVSFAAPDAPVQRITAHVCPTCFALVTDRDGHVEWHGTVPIRGQDVERHRGR